MTKMLRCLPALCGLAFLLGCQGASGGEGPGRRRDVRDFVQGYVGAIAENLPSLARTKAWPNQGFEDVSVETVFVSAGGGRIVYEVLVEVRDELACQGAQQGGLDIAREVRVGHLAFSPAEVREYTKSSGKSTTTVRPTDYLCRDRAWPVRLAFSFRQPLAE